jgi:hypothetical protein
MFLADLLSLLHSVDVHVAVALAGLAAVWRVVVLLVTLPDRVATVRLKARAARLNAEADVIDADVRLLEARACRARACLEQDIARCPTHALTRHRDDAMLPGTRPGSSEVGGKRR